MEKESKKRGAPKGNQYARKHGFYSPVLDEKEQREYEMAIEVEGLDEEIAMLRVKIISLIERDPENIRLITQAINTLVRLVKTKYETGQGDKLDWKEGVANVLKGVAAPAGFVIESALEKLG